MNFKLLFTTFRNRYRFIQSKLIQYCPIPEAPHASPLTPHPSTLGLNLGTGEGDYDRMIAARCTELIGCDVNEADLEHARALNKDVANLRYEVNDALNLRYPDAHFDLIVSCEVIEHVGQPDRMVKEMYRVLKPGGIVLMTFPSREFPFTYDPINRIWQLTRSEGSREYAISQGAYAFGHSYLIGSADFKRWAVTAGFEIVEFQGLSHHLVGLLEVYWTGIAQSIFKKNAGNVTSDKTGRLSVRPTSTKAPALVFVTDFLLWLDRALFGWTGRSCGKGVVLRKR